MIAVEHRRWPNFRRTPPTPGRLPHYFVCPLSPQRFILKHTPLGATAAEVAAFVNHKLNHGGGRAPSWDERGYMVGTIVLGTGQKAPANWSCYYPEVPDLGPVLRNLHSGGSATMDIWLGQYWGIPFRVGVICHWKFDSAGKLIEVSVTKEADAL